MQACKTFIALATGGLLFSAGLQPLPIWFEWLKIRRAANGYLLPPQPHFTRATPEIQFLRHCWRNTAADESSIQSQNAWNTWSYRACFLRSSWFGVSWVNKVLFNHVGRLFAALQWILRNIQTTAVKGQLATNHHHQKLSFNFRPNVGNAHLNP